MSHSPYAGPPDPRPAPLLPPAPPPPAPPATPPHDAAEAHPRSTIWQAPFVQEVLPFLTSLSLHVAVIVLGLMAAKVVTTVIQPPLRQQVHLAEGGLAPDDASATADALGFSGLGGGDPTRPPMQDKFPDVPADSRGVADKPGPNLTPRDLGGGAGDRGDLDLYAIGPNAAIGTGRGRGSGAGDVLGPGDGDGTGVLAPFGPPNRSGPRGGIFHIPPRQDAAAARRVYVCDASGSMLETFDALRFEIRRSVDALRVSQSFNVVFFQDPGFLALDRSALVMATPENRRRTVEFLETVVPRGTTDPIPALDAVARMKPDVVFLLTDGDFSGPGNQRVVEHCRRLFFDGRTRIHTIAFLNREAKVNPQELAFAKALQEIARDSGGSFRFVSEADMGR